MSEAVKRYSVFIGFEHGEQQMVLAADHDRIVAELRGDLEASDKLTSQSRDRNSRLRKERDTLRAEVERLRIALSHAGSWIEAAPHGENCFVSSHYDGDPGSRCNCGKDSAQEAIESAMEASR